MNNRLWRKLWRTGAHGDFPRCPINALFNPFKHAIGLTKLRVQIRNATIQTSDISTNFIKLRSNRISSIPNFPFNSLKMHLLPGHHFLMVPLLLGELLLVSSFRLFLVIPI